MTASRAEKRESKESVLQDFVRYSIRAAHGLGNIAEEEGKELVRRMIDVKRISSDEGDRLLETLMSKMHVSRDVFEERVKETVTNAVEKLSSISSRELGSITSRLETLDQRIADLVSKKNFRAQV